MERKIIQIFVASPGGVEEERAVVRARAQKQNNLLARRTGVQLEVIGWEDLSPYPSRPQERINGEADSVAVFVGILGARWGSPTGQYSSGFEEEFERAKARFESTQLPDIRLFFKQIDSSDPGPQLASVIAFREAIEAERKFLFKSFSAVDDFSEAIDKLFVDLMFDHSTQSGEIQTPEKTNTDEPDISTHPNSMMNSGNVEKSKVEAESREIEGSFRALLAESEKTPVTEADRGRALIFAATKFAAVQSEQLLGVHALNALYKSRRSWSLTEAETWVLFRGSLQSVNRPGWFWVRGYDPQFIEYWLWHLALHDDESTFRNAVRFLEYAEVAPPIGQELQVLLEKKDSVQVVASWVTACGTEQHLSYLEEVWPSLDSSLQTVLTEPLLTLCSKYKPNATLDRLGQLTAACTVSESRLGELIGHLKDAELAALLSVVQSKSIRKGVALNLLNRNSELALNQAAILRADDDVAIRKMAVIRQIESGKKFSDDELHALFPEIKANAGKVSSLLGLMTQEERVNLADFYRPMLNLLKYEDLVEHIDFFSEIGRVAYRVLALHHFNRFSERLKQDVSDDFESLRIVSDEKSKARGGIALTPIYEEGNDLIGFLKSHFARIVFEAFMLHGIEDDVEIGRQLNQRAYVTTYEVSWIASFFTKLGQTKDVPLMLGIASKVFGTALRGLLEKIMEVAADKNALLDVLIENYPTAAKKLIVEHMLLSEREVATQRAVEWLSSESEPQRALGIAFMVKALDESDLEKCLDDYVEQPTYYYDVVMTFDARLYALNPIKTRVEKLGHL